MDILWSVCVCVRERERERASAYFACVSDVERALRERERRFEVNADIVDYNGTYFPASEHVSSNG